MEAVSWLNERGVGGNKDGKGGQAKVVIWTPNKEEVEGALQDIISAVTDAGFPCELKNLQID